MSIKFLIKIKKHLINKTINATNRIETYNVHFRRVQVSDRDKCG